MRLRPGGARDNGRRFVAAYAKQSAGASPEEAGMMATQIVDQVREADAVDHPKNIPSVPIADGSKD